MLLIGKPSINGLFSMAMLNNQRVNGSFESIEIEHDRSEHYKARPNQTPFLDPVEHSILT